MRFDSYNNVQRIPPGLVENESAKAVTMTVAVEPCFKLIFWAFKVRAGLTFPVSRLPASLNG